MTTDERLHYLAGFALGLGFWRFSRVRAEAKIRNLDHWAWRREVAQHDNELTPHQILEARAWGWGARTSRVLRLPYPSPPYPV